MLSRVCMIWYDKNWKFLQNISTDLLKWNEKSTSNLKKKTESFLKTSQFFKSKFWNL